MAEINCGGAFADFELLLSCPSGLSPSQVNVHFSEEYDRIPHPDVNLENSIAEIWNQKVQSTPSLYNGRKFRFGGFSLCNNNGGCNQLSNVVLKLGLTEYRTFVGTNLSPLWEKFLVPSEDDNVHCQHTASPLGNGAVIETSDKKILILKRSNEVGEFPGTFVFPGGHAEPQEIGILSHDKDSTDSEFLNKKVAQEMFDSVVREVVEETGVPASSLCDPVFIGISRRRLNVRPVAFFFMRCTLESQEIQHMYSTAEDGFESTQLYAVSRDDIKSMLTNMPGCHQGGFALYSLMIDATKDASQ